MTRSRIVGFVVILVCLIAAPQLLADHDKDKKDRDKSSTQQSHSNGNGQQHSSSQGSNNNGNNNQHGSSGQSHTGGGSGSGMSGIKSGTSNQTGGSGQSGTSSNGGYHKSGDTNRQPVTDTGHGEHRASSNETFGHSHDTYPKTHVDTAHHGDVRVDHAHATFDHDHFRARMSEHPDATARAHAYEHFRDERAHFTRHVEAVHFVPAHRVILTRVRIVPATYHYRRTVFYEEYGWTPPVYVYSMYPRYGLWDAMFLAFALDHIAEDQYALLFYHHMQEPEMQAWLADNQRLAADNEELRARLDTMQTKVASMQESGITSDPGYVPPDAQDVALSPDVIAKLTAGTN